MYTKGIIILQEASMISLHCIHGHEHKGSGSVPPIGTFNESIQQTIVRDTTLKVEYRDQSRGYDSSSQFVPRGELKGFRMCKISHIITHRVSWWTIRDLIHRYKNQKSFELRHRIIQMLLSSDAFALFLLLVEYRYSYQIPSVHRILQWIIIWLFLHILKPLSSPLGTNWLDESYPLLWSRYSTFKVVSLTVVCCIYSLNIPMGGIYTSIICMNLETSMGHTPLVLRQIKFQQDNFIEIEKWIESYFIEEVGVDPEPLSSCPWIRWRTYHERSL